MKKLAIIILLLLALLSFWKINELNYWKHIQIRDTLVEHPENLPIKQVAKNTSIWFKNLRADLFWLKTIQYIWWNAVSSEYKKYLYTVLDLITELNPYFEHPYIIWLLLLPDYNERYENLSIEEQNINIKQAEQIWLKWIDNFCDKEKLELIKQEFNLNELWNNEKYKNSCLSFDVPYYLAYVYYFYLNNPIEASNYYKIASAQNDSLEGSKIMAAIMLWKWWNREKAYFMFLNMAKNMGSSDDKVCYNYASELEQIWSLVFWKKLKLNGKLLEQIRLTRNKIIWVFDEEKQKDILSDTQCSNYVNKATRELNLYYIEQANKIYKTNNNWESATNTKILLDKLYIDYLPIDFQQYDTYWIIYQYNPDTGNFDYEMWNY